MRPENKSNSKSLDKMSKINLVRYFIAQNYCNFVQ